MANFERVQTDLTIVGAGFSGVCAAIAAARQGLVVALINDRPVLGGNASSELRVWLNGASGPPSGHASAGRNIRYAREGGIVEELILKNKFSNPDGNAYLFDMILMDTVLEESNIKLFLNTVITDVQMDNPRRVRLVRGHQLMSETCFEFESPRFVDASGDGVVAFQAGAEFRVGSEAREQYDEIMAPITGDSNTMGSTIMFSTRDAGYPVDFHPPGFAHDFKQNPPRSLEKKANPNESRCCWWWVEWGGELDTIKDSEKIRAELLAIVYGAWDYIKNSGRFPEARNLQLEWVGSIPGKRESRRFIGPFVITEHDVVNQQTFPDTVAHGGWPIDLHPAEGFYEPEGRGSRHLWLNGPYEIPYRVLISKDLDNLWLAGRSISASRVAFGTMRVQMTLGALGQAIGTAAAIAHRNGLNVQDFDEEHTNSLQQQLLLDDQWLIGVKNSDERDIAPQAVVRASSTRAYSAEGRFWRELDHDVAITFPVCEQLRTIRLRLRSEHEQSMPVEVWTSNRLQNFIPERTLGSKVVILDQGEQVVDIDVSDLPTDTAFIGITLPSALGVAVFATDEELTGVTASTGLPEDEGPFWRLLPWIPAFRVEGGSPYKAENVTNGYNRPYGGPNSWISEPIKFNPEWIDLEWSEHKTISTVQLTFNSSLNTNLLNLSKTDYPSVPQIVRDYRILAVEQGEWREILVVSGNYQKVRRHGVGPVRTDRIRVELLHTNGAPCAEIFEIRVY